MLAEQNGNKQATKMAPKPKDDGYETEKSFKPNSNRKTTNASPSKAGARSGSDKENQSAPRRNNQSPNKRNQSSNQAAAPTVTSKKVFCF